jgi:hypothetical protein
MRDDIASRLRLSLENCERRPGKRKLKHERAAVVGDAAHDVETSRSARDIQRAVSREVLRETRVRVVAQCRHPRQRREKIRSIFGHAHFRQMSKPHRHFLTAE